MKKVLFIIPLFFLFVGYSQTADQIGPSSYQVQLIPKNPDVANLGKFGDIPVNKYNGTANINISIHNIDFDGLKIPISLNYNTSGIRVNEDASWVGLGWNLSSGIVLTRDVNGFEDIRDSDINTDSKGWIYTKDYGTPQPPYYAHEIISTDMDFLTTRYLSNNPQDTEPDLFSVTLPDGSFKFILQGLIVIIEVKEC